MGEITKEEVSEKIVNNASESEAKVNDVIIGILENEKEEPSENKSKKNSKPKKNTLDYNGRGFTTLEDAINFVKTEKFKKLGKADQEEYLNWLNK